MTCLCDLSLLLGFHVFRTVVFEFYWAVIQCFGKSRLSLPLDAFFSFFLYQARNAETLKKSPCLFLPVSHTLLHSTKHPMTCTHCYFCDD